MSNDSDLILEASKAVFNEQKMANIDEFADREERGNVIDANHVIQGDTDLDNMARPEQPDLYRDIQKKRYESSKKQDRHGANKMVKNATKAAIQRLAPKYAEFRGAYDHFMEIGQRDRAEQLRQQYYMDDYLPAIESIIMVSSPDDVLNSDEALAKLDQYSGVTGSGVGFVKSYILSAYGDMLGQNPSGSDELVQRMVYKIRKLGAEGSARAAAGLAKSIKARIDSGENLASEEDYILISRVAS